MEHFLRVLRGFLQPAGNDHEFGELRVVWRPFDLGQHLGGHCEFHKFLFGVERRAAATDAVFALLPGLQLHRVVEGAAYTSVHGRHQLRHICDDDLAHALEAMLVIVAYPRLADLEFHFLDRRPLAVDEA